MTKYLKITKYLNILQKIKKEEGGGATFGRRLGTPAARGAGPGCKASGAPGAATAEAGSGRGRRCPGAAVAVGSGRGWRRRR
jgi:hypothetical protein